jgi:hypothetical protein
MSRRVRSDPERRAADLTVTASATFQNYCRSCEAERAAKRAQRRETARRNKAKRRTWLKTMRRGRSAMSTPMAASDRTAAGKASKIARAQTATGEAPKAASDRGGVGHA